VIGIKAIKEIDTDKMSLHIEGLYYLLITTLIVCVSALTNTDELKSQVFDYGIYCGLGHTNVLGLEPIDELDRICQIHDICTGAAGLTSCFCNEQLYEKMSIYIPSTSAQSSEKNTALTTAYTAISPCSNYLYIDDMRLISNCPSLPCTNQQGFTYFPIYPSSTNYKFINVQSVTNIKAYKVSNVTYYNQFTQYAYNNPINTWKSLDNNPLYTPITLGLLILRPSEPSVYIFVNYDPNTISNIIYNEYPNSAVNIIVYQQGNVVAWQNKYNSMYQRAMEYYNTSVSLNNQLNSVNDDIDYTHNLESSNRIYSIVIYCLSSLIGVIIITSVVIGYRKYRQTEAQLAFVELNRAQV